MAVTHHTTCRELDLLQESITICVFLIVVAQDLECEQTDQVDDYNQYSHATNHILPFIQSVVAFHHLLLRFSITRINR